MIYVSSKPDFDAVVCIQDAYWILDRHYATVCGGAWPGMHGFASAAASLHASLL